MDTQGFLLESVVHEANIQDRDGAKILFERMRDRFPRLKIIWADGGYAGKLLDWVKENCSWNLEIVKRNDSGFVVLPRRWIVERTFAWLGRYKRLSKDYEFHTDTSENMLLLAMSRLMLNRLNHV